MKKYLLLAILLIAIPATTFARGGGSVGGFHSSGGGSFSGGGHVSAPAPSFHPSAPVTSGGTHSSFSSEEPITRSYSAPTNNYYNGGSNFWFYWWLFSHNNSNRDAYKDDQFITSEHMPYVVILDKSKQEYLLVRYIGKDHLTEKVSEQEAAGLTWLKGSIKY